MRPARAGGSAVPFLPEHRPPARAAARGLHSVAVRLHFANRRPEAARRFEAATAGPRGELRMTGRRPDTHIPDRGASRREFFKLLAASPLLGVASSGLPASWQRALAHEAERRATPGTATPHCPECGAEMLPSLTQPRFNALQDPALPPQNALEDQLTGQVIESQGRRRQRLGLRARGACQQSGPALGLPAHGGRRLRDEEGEPGRVPAPDDSSAAARRRGPRPGSTRRSSSSAAAGTRPSFSVPSRASRPITRRARAAPRGRPAQEASCSCSRIRARSRTPRSPRPAASRTSSRSTRRPTGT